MIRRPPRYTRTDPLFPSTTLFRSDIAVAAAVGKGTIYEYFDSKADLFWAVCENLVHWPEKADSYTADPKKGSEEHTSELQSLMRISYAVFCLKKKKKIKNKTK